MKVLISNKSTLKTFNFLCDFLNFIYLLFFKDTNLKSTYTAQLEVNYFWEKLNWEFCGSMKDLISIIIESDSKESASKKYFLGKNRMAKFIPVFFFLLLL